MKLLIADDNGAFRNGLSRVLALQGHTVLEASDGLIASELAFEQYPDVILCDFVMPRMNGLTLYLLLRKNSQTRHIPFILMTGSTRMEELQSWQMEALTEVILLPKPFDFDQLFAVLARFSPINVDDPMLFQSRSQEAVDELPLKDHE